MFRSMRHEERWNEDHTLRKCAACEIFKEEANFGLSIRARDGYKTYCKSCEKIIVQCRKDGTLPPWVIKDTELFDGVKKCNTCGEEKFLYEFRKEPVKGQNKGRRGICKVCISKKEKQNRVDNPELAERRTAECKLWHTQIKCIALAGYGGECVCCGEDRFELLSIDHINGNGRKHRREEINGRSIYQWLVAENYPLGFRILCYNCNCSDGFFGKCPHGKSDVTNGSVMECDISHG